MAKICFLLKFNLVTARKKIFKIFVQLLKVKTTYKLNIILVNMLFLKNYIKRDQVYSNTRVPTQVNTNQHESTRVRDESNTSQHESDTSQHKSTRVQNRS